VTIIGTLLDGRTIVKTTHVQVVPAGTVWLEVTVPELKHIDAVLNVQVEDTDPKTYAYGPQHKTIVGNVVGISLQEVGATTTLTLEVVTIGY